MSVVTQGTQLYVLANGVVSEIECITAFSPGGSPADQIDDTCLSERNTRKYKKGLRTPGQATATLNADPTNASHLMLSNMAESNDQSDVTFAIGWSDGESEPTAGTGPEAVDGLTLPSDRTWYVFKGYVSDFPFDFQGNTVVQTSATIQRSGQGAWIPKAQSGS
ncbi:phage tail protein [Escherichia coli]|uniref:phage tail tube protein n=1 Tax=Enterobacter hormaechei TaxID=158836 RepID=UPI00079C0700|nr:phage tail tube protein [Enterobacter hormaechei]MDU1655129.1 phage tail tube protein [Leclercia adecarboxylata]MWT07998.1 phage tail protein [Escherichia coli]HDR2613508.1 phage tail protein [Enterobacter ludwigii]MBJ6449201.1 phage tail protein [Enterobacter hormaechei]MPV46462.1 phage tail protein [Enterobacter hormaechei]